ncbi:MAG: YfbM family protein [Moraxellaceae bacterium]
MGIVGYFTAIDSEVLSDLRADPEQTAELLFPNDGEDEPENTIDVDKSWHGLHFILCELAKGGSSALESAILGGEPLGEDFGYGPPRVLTPSEVQAIAIALSAITDEVFASQFNPAAMEAQEIYPQFWERDGAEALDYLKHFFPSLVAFYADAAAQEKAVVLWLA